MNGVVKNISALAIETTGQLVVMTKGQKELLQCIRSCVTNKTIMDWDTIVSVYCAGVRSVHRDFWRVRYGNEDHPREYDIMNEYKNHSGIWTYTIRPIIRRWLVSNIGILVLKNQLVIIPTIDIGE